MKYAVSKGNTVEFGVAKKSGNDTTVVLKSYSEGELIDFDDKVEINRLSEAGIIRPLEHTAAVEEDEEGK
ncbi:hypothetical protein [Acinetobacter sp. Ac_5812]|uniref:hypothetical protein n=1 Tax=Acinetobacter sp. Ac_5812 TaxID=1848937 RepID=UPI00148F81D0|nr:hypothetical protein [Acinetobacter sp. Ac_5812]NNP68957.1 hypothetical protein [Acinetobacter sp. Ac_5812]